MIKAPPILSELELAGCNSELILIELEELKEITPILKQDTTIFFASNSDELAESSDNSAWFQSNSISKIVRAIHSSCKEIKQQHEHKIKINYIIHRIDLMDLHIGVAQRGSLRKGMLATLSKKILGDSNVIITSATEEYMLRDLCDRHINLRLETK